MANKKIIKIEKLSTNRSEWQDVGLLAQLILTISVLFFGVVATFDIDFLNVVEKLLGLTILSMAYNNYLTYKRKNMTIIYTVLGFAVFVIACMGW